MHIFGTKGQRYKFKILSWDGTACQNPGRDAGQDNHYLFPISSCFRTSFPVLKRTFFSFRMSFSVLERPFSCFLVSFGKVILSRDDPGQGSYSQDFCSCPCPGTKVQQDKEIFLSREKGTMGQWDVPSLGNPSTVLCGGYWLFSILL